MVAGKRSRYLAPLALAAVIAATVVVVRSGLHSSHPRATGGTTSTLISTGQTRHVHHHHGRFYTVQAGDTLSAIAGKTGVPLATIESLNPGLDPRSLQTGERLKLGR